MNMISHVRNFFFIWLLCLCVVNNAAMPLHAKIYVAGHNGMVGRSLMRLLSEQGYTNIVVRSSAALDLRDQSAVDQFFAQEKPEYVFLVAARVGGIKANIDRPAEFIYDNLLLSANVIHAAYKHGAKKLLYFGSSCVYPRECPQPMKEEYLLTGLPEKTNEGYAIAKIAGIKLCQTYNQQYGTHFISCMLPNLYGPHDNFNLETSHVISALIRRIHQAKQDNQPSVVLWGSGGQRREFLYVDDCTEAALFLMNMYDENEMINVGYGGDVSILQLAQLIKDVVGYEGEIATDLSKPEGMPRKLMDASRVQARGWQAQVSLREGLERTYAWCQENQIFN